MITKIYNHIVVFYINVSELIKSKKTENVIERNWSKFHLLVLFKMDFITSWKIPIKVIQCVKVIKSYYIYESLESS